MVLLSLEQAHCLMDVVEQLDVTSGHYPSATARLLEPG